MAGSTRVLEAREEAVVARAAIPGGMELIEEARAPPAKVTLAAAAALRRRIMLEATAPAAAAREEQALTRA